MQVLRQIPPKRLQRGGRGGMVDGRIATPTEMGNDDEEFFK